MQVLSLTSCHKTNAHQAKQNTLQLYLLLTGAFKPTQYNCYKATQISKRCLKSQNYHMQHTDERASNEAPNQWFNH